jgi:hypothetical protein
VHAPRYQLPRRSRRLEHSQYRSPFILSFHLVLKTTHLFINVQRHAAGLYSSCQIFWKGIAMKLKSLLLVLIFALTPLICAQDAPAQAPAGAGGGNQVRAEHRKKMMEMHKQEMDAMKADVGR